MGVPTPRTARQLASDTEERLTLLERAMAQTTLPQRLSTHGQQAEDWNDAIAPGFYWSESSALNGPVSNILVGHVFVKGGASNARVFQEVYVPSTEASTRSKSWRRVNTAADGSGTWTPWGLVQDGGLIKLIPTASDLVNATVDEDGAITLAAPVSGWAEVRNIFSTAYSRYRIAWKIGSTVGGNTVPLFRWIAGSSMFSTSATYGNSRGYINSSGSWSSAYSDDSYGRMASSPVSPAFMGQGMSEIFDPALAGERTSLLSQSSVGALWNNASTVMTVGDAFDGIAFNRGPTVGSDAIGNVAIYAYT